MVLGTTVDLSVLSYPVLVIMKGQGVDIGRGGASPGAQTSSEAEPALSHRARQSLPSAVGRVRASSQLLGEAEPTLSHWARRSLPSDVGRGGAYPQPSSEAELALRR